MTHHYFKGKIMQKIICRVIILGFTIITIGLLASCGTATPPDQTQRPPAFLPNYGLLKPVPSPKGTKMYVYKDPGVKRSDYHAVIVEPVSLYQTATKEGVTEAQIEKARANLDAGI